MTADEGRFDVNISIDDSSVFMKEDGTAATGAGRHAGISQLQVTEYAVAQRWPDTSVHRGNRPGQQRDDSYRGDAESREVEAGLETRLGPPAAFRASRYGAQGKAALAVSVQIESVPC